MSSAAAGRRGTPPYSELHSHSAYSFLDGASLPDELVACAVRVGYGAMALTDHDNLCGAMEYAIAARGMGLRAIHGAEVTIEHPDGGMRHLTLLVRDQTGWGHLCRLLTLAHAHTRDGTDRRAGQPSVPLGRLLERSEGLVCLTGCAAHGVHDEATCRGLLDAFGPESLRVELQRPFERHDKARNRALADLARRLGVKTVATGDVHAHTPARALLQDAFAAIRLGLTLEASEPDRRGNHAHVLADPWEMAARFPEHPDAVAETVRLAETLRFDLAGDDLGYRYPLSDSNGAARRLAELCAHELAERYPASHPDTGQAAGRLQQELAIIDELGLSGFFLLHHEILELAREIAVQVRGPGSARALLPPGRGRGSSVSSIVCYLTGLSHIDPIANDLAIGRFLHSEIESLPDIDIDFPRDIRERLIAEIPRRYGPDRAALVAAFPTFKSRGAIREIGTVLGLPEGEIERVARASEGHGQDDVKTAIESSLGSRRLTGRWAWLARLADQAQGLPRHISQHPGGMVIATRPLVDCCPIVPAAMQDRQMIQWDKDSASDAGFLKIDLLSLGMLSAVERCVELIAERTQERVDLSRIDYDDQRVYETIQAAETTGVFQIESRAQMASLLRTRPRSLQDLTIQVALVRPGPIVGGAVNPYIERRQKQLNNPNYKPPFLHPSLEGPLAESLGTIIFQDQVIEVARCFAGFSAGQAEGLRRAMSRKRSQEAIDSYRAAFIAGAKRTHPDAGDQVIEQVRGMVAGFAGFGFPKAHGAAFGLLAYQSTWLRVHHPAAFLCALLNEQPMGFYPPDSLIHEAQRRGLTVLAPDLNASEADCALTDKQEIRVGLSYITGIHERDIARLLRARRHGGPFTSLGDFAARSGISSTALEMLAWSGACDALAGGGSHARRTALWQLGLATPARPVRGGEQLALDLPLEHAPALPSLGAWDAMLADYAATGISLDHHPVGLLRDQLTAQGAPKIAELRQITHGASVTVGGLVIARQRPQTAGGITFILLEDESATANVIIPQSLYERQRLLVRSEPLLLIAGRLERHPAAGGGINLLAQHLQRLAHSEETSAATVRKLHRDGPSADRDFNAVAPAAQSFGRGRRR